MTRVAHHRGPVQHRTPYNLSPADMRVMLLLVEGLMNAEIARRLCITVPSVEKRVHAILVKMGARTRVEIAVRWVREVERPVPASP